MRNGGYSVTVRHEHFKQGAAGGVLRHAIRSVEEEHGIFREHSNKNIDATRTSQNVVLVNDGKGGFKEADSPEEVMQHRKSLLAKRADKRKLRSNQNTFMETLVQLDEEFAGSSQEFLNDAKGTADETGRLLEVLTEHIVNKVGQQNVNYIALHVDETSPHIQIGWTPLAEDGSLDFRKILGETKLWKKDGRMRGTLTKKMMSDQHKEVRELMNQHGYPAVEVFSTPRHEKHAPYKRQQQQLNETLIKREQDIKQREDDCELRERRVSNREESVKTDKTKLDTERDDFAQEMDKQRRELDTQRRQHQEAVRKQKEDLDKREKALKEKTEAEQQKISNERDAMLTEVQEREDSVGERENSVEAWEERQVKTRKAVAKFMDSRYYRNAVEHPMEVSREQATFVNEVRDLYADIRRTGLEPTRSTPSDRARSRSEATTTHAKPRTPTKGAQSGKSDILRDIAEARAKKRKGTPPGGGQPQGGGKPQGGGDGPDY